MNIAGICFTNAGMELAEKIRELLGQFSEKKEIQTRWYCKGQHFENAGERGFEAVEEPMQDSRRTAAPRNFEPPITSVSSHSRVRGSSLINGALTNPLFAVVKPAFSILFSSLLPDTSPT